MSLEAARNECLLADSYGRMEVVMGWSPMTRFSGPKLRSDLWWRLLGEQWSVCDNIAEWSDVLREMLRRAPRHHVEKMMDANERAALQSMGERFTVWRGCYEFNADGLSWTTDRTMAAGFPFLSRYRYKTAAPLLVEGTVVRRQVVLKLDRGEGEVIAPKVDVLNVTGLSPVSAST